MCDLLTNKVLLKKGVLCFTGYLKDWSRGCDMELHASERFMKAFYNTVCFSVTEHSTARFKDVFKPIQKAQYLVLVVQPNLSLVGS